MKIYLTKKVFFVGNILFITILKKNNLMYH